MRLNVTYGSHHICFLTMLSLFLPPLCSSSAPISRALWIPLGSWTPGGRERDLAATTLMVSSPVREMGGPLSDATAAGAAWTGAAACGGAGDERLVASLSSGHEDEGSAVVVGQLRCCVQE